MLSKNKFRFYITLFMNEPSCFKKFEIFPRYYILKITIRWFFVSKPFWKKKHSPIILKIEKKKNKTKIIYAAKLY